MSIADLCELAFLKNRVAELESREALLQAEHKYLRKLFDQAPLAYQSLDDTGCFLEVNLAWLEALGYTREEVIGRNFGEFLHLDWRDHFKELFPKLKAIGEILGNEFEMVRKDGSTILVSFHGKIDKDPGGQFRQTHCMFQDITERKRTEIALSDRKAYLHSILSAAPIGIGVTKNRVLQEVNTRLCEMTGFTENELLNKSSRILYPGEAEYNWVGEEKYRQILQYGTGTVETRWQRKDGSSIDILLSSTPIDRNDFSRGVTFTALDISERKRMEAQLLAAKIDLERKVEQRTLELQETHKKFLHAEKLSAIGQLSASIAHEFNNPLQGILSILKGLKKRAMLEEEDRELLNAAISESDRIKDLIRSLQDFNRPSSGRSAFIDIHQSLESILLLYKSDFNKRRIIAERCYAENLPTILAVPDQIKQVFLNLLTNAADACNHHGGVITISTWQEDNNVAVAIKDTGIGIKASDMEQIFRPFYTTKSEVKGTGLGLSVSHGIVKKHHGEIRVESQPGQGATFTVLLPIKVETATDR